MKAIFYKFKAFIQKHIWADFLFVFILYFTIQAVSNQMRSDGKSINDLLFTSACFSIIGTPIFRLLRPNEEGLGLYVMVDNVRHYQVGQRELLKSYLESKGYTIFNKEGSVLYFNSKNEGLFSNQKTFIHETNHWIALVAPPKILEEVPSTISSICPQKAS